VSEIFTLVSGIPWLFHSKELEPPVTWIRLTAWLKATLPALGGPGPLLSAFLDSSFIPMPLVTDLIVMELSSRHPIRIPYYATLANLARS
jgi:hypothetical protein